MQFSMTSPVSPWRIIGASVVGTSHHGKGLGCDDDHVDRLLDNGIVLLAIADGAGSVSHAAEGASYAVHEACNVAQNLIAQQTEPANKEEWRTVLSTVLHTVRVGLENVLSSKSDSHTNALSEFATTLQFAIITSQWIAVAQIGDGAVVIQHTSGEVEALTWPDHGDYINQTSFITDSDYLDRAQYAAISCSEIQGVALFTDGLERLALEFAAKKPYEPFFTPIFRFAADISSTKEKLEEYLGSAPVCERTSDDKTLVLAVLLRQEMEESGPLDRNR